MTVTVLTKESLIEIKHEVLNAMRESLDKKPEEPKKWLRTSELCDVLQMSASSLQTLRNNGTLKYEKVDGHIYYDYEHIIRLLEKQAT